VATGAADVDAVVVVADLAVEVAVKMACTVVELAVVTAEGSASTGRVLAGWPRAP